MALPVESETTAYKRYLTLKDRRTIFPNGKTVAWDVVGHDVPAPTFVVVFPFHTKTKTVTLIREYAQGINNSHTSFPSGGISPKKHASARHAARDELNEEARLEGGTWIPLIDETAKGIGELKWSTNQFIPYLVLDPVPSQTPLPRDEEELIEILPNVSLGEFRAMVKKGEVLGPTAITFLSGIEQLKEMGLVGPEDL